LPACAVDEVVEHWPAGCECGHAFTEEERVVADGPLRWQVEELPQITVTVTNSQRGQKMSSVRMMPLASREFAVRSYLNDSIEAEAPRSADPAEIPAFVETLMAGADFVKGTRFREGGGSHHPVATSRRLC